MKKVFIIALSAVLFLMTGFVRGQSGFNFNVPINNNDKTQVLILASPHLSQFRNEFRPPSLDSLIMMFRFWQPDLIGVEAQPPHIIDFEISEGYNYEPVIQQYAGVITLYGNMAREKLGIFGPEARYKADSLLTKAEEGYKVNKSDLIMHLLAAYDYYSALLQWAYLSKIQMDDLSLPLEIKKHLDNALLTVNEINAIGIRVALDSRLERLYQIDDHTDKDIFLTFSDILMDEFQVTDEFYEVMNSSLYRNSDERMKIALRQNNLFPYFLYLNSPVYLQEDFNTQWAMFFRTNLPSGLDRSRVALWEVRNLNIASNIRKISAMYPGYRILVIIGANHKPFLDRYLSAMLDIKVVQLKDVYDSYRE